jgi:hypothetical protein
MAKETHIGSGLPSLINQLRDLMTSAMVEDFESLKTYSINAGPPGMDAAQWLEAVVKDRRDGMIVHARLLRATFESLADALSDAGRLLSGADGDGASGLAAIEAWLSSSNPSLLLPIDYGYADGRTSYDSGDTGGNPRLVYQVTDAGDHVTEEGGVVIDVPDKKDALDPDIYDELIDGHVVDEKRDEARDKKPDFMFVSDGYVVK